MTVIGGLGIAKIARAGAELIVANRRIRRSSDLAQHPRDEQDQEDEWQERENRGRGKVRLALRRRHLTADRTRQHDGTHR
jgi:hypothetical protein